MPMMPMMAMPSAHLQAPMSPQPAQWYTPPASPQRMPSLASSPALPFKARGAAPEAPPAPPKFVMPTPEELGIATQIPAKQTPSMDWNAIHARMERLGVLNYDRKATGGGVCVTLLLPMSDPTRAQPIEAVATTEAAAALAALEYAEAWMQKR